MFWWSMPPCLCPFHLNHNWSDRQLWPGRTLHAPSAKVPWHSSYSFVREGLCEFNTFQNIIEKFMLWCYVTLPIMQTRTIHICPHSNVLCCSILVSMQWSLVSLETSIGLTSDPWWLPGVFSTLSMVPRPVWRIKDWRHWFVSVTPSVKPSHHPLVLSSPPPRQG